ncbi:MULTISPECIES: HAD-IA family hydrolase [Lachnospiraceae]|jgi:phosphoglycolate phosphatase|uniref:HAD-IA family hydrolase n=1 Tax=Faecalicatena acetigenes TaxID=2981790 RepID=A0ABT2TCZ6_9FIRM|nr:MULTISPECIES: HAD-IA family hydrolase [Lachnospiraceae]MCU6747594.1 HAD-IA family hydrolase [Faecalicatena acetigenes]RGT73222.1 HAD family hydrolase [Ruminococcus sp. AF18-22]SCH98228.1 5'-nucleotidase [uncultured Clostridium sp.]
MGIHTIAFDLDGTITDSGPGILNSINYALEKSGRQREDTEKLKCFIGPPLAGQFEKFCNITREESLQMVQYYREYYSVKGIFENRVYEGMEKVFQSLIEHDFRLVIATSKPEHFAKIIAKHFGFDKYFAFIGGALLDEGRTDKTEVIEYVLEHFQIRDRKEILMVGDRSYDMIGAAQTGVHSLGVLYGYGSREELEEAKAERLVSVPEEIASVIIKNAENWI